MHEQFLKTLRLKLSSSLPGKKAQQKMAPSFRSFKNYADSLRDAAVLILLYPKKDQIYTVLIKRNVYNGPHSGQISLPGGGCEPADKSLEYTALRETQEEIGINADKISIIGRITELIIPVSNFCVHPYIGWLPDVPSYIPDAKEVQFLMEVKLNQFIDTENIKSTIINKEGQSIFTPYYEINGEMIWGATAMILSEFMELVDF